ncbi:Single-stranded-DNA-specific exonuclease RecJ, partial [termite gut metagenome]
MSYKWNYRPITHEQEERSRVLAQELEIDPIVGRLLTQRGITNSSEAETFFYPQLSDLHDPFLMKNMV